MRTTRGRADNAVTASLRHLAAAAVPVYATTTAAAIPVHPFRDGPLCEGTTERGEFRPPPPLRLDPLPRVTTLSADFRCAALDVLRDAPQFTLHFVGEGEQLPVGAVRIQVLAPALEPARTIE